MFCALVIAISGVNVASVAFLFASVAAGFTSMSLSREKPVEDGDEGA
jgi:hypothetical protein